jgi:hypothetical protein
MQSKSVSAATVALCVVGASVYGWYALDNPAPLLALVLVPGLVAYARALWLDLDAERRRIYRLEVERGEDLTGDGVIGQPQGHVVTVQGQPAFTLPDLHPDTPPAPPPALVYFPCTANDVLAVLDRAAEVGLGFRQWEGKVLPSGVKLDRPAWGAVQDGMLRWQFATARQTATGRRVDLRLDIGIEAMKDAVVKGAGEP